jgi:hypothetical protein
VASNPAAAAWQMVTDFRAVVQNEDLVNLRMEIPFRPSLADDFANRVAERLCPAGWSQAELAVVRGHPVAVLRSGGPAVVCRLVTEPLPVEWVLNTTRRLWAVTQAALDRSVDRSKD